MSAEIVETVETVDTATSGMQSEHAGAAQAGTPLSPTEQVVRRIIVFGGKRQQPAPAAERIADFV